MLADGIRPAFLPRAARLLLTAVLCAFACALVFSAAHPVSSWADDDVLTAQEDDYGYPLWVGGVRVTPANLDNVFKEDAQTFGLNGKGEIAVSFSPATEVGPAHLKLNGAQVGGAYEFAGGRAGVYWAGEGKLVIDLVEGTLNAVTPDGDAVGGHPYYGIYAQTGDIEVAGAAALDITSNENAAVYCMNGTFSIASGTSVQASGRTAEQGASSDHTSAAVRAKGLSMQGGELSAVSEGGIAGVYVASLVLGDDAVVNARGSSYGVQAGALSLGGSARLVATALGATGIGVRVSTGNTPASFGVSGAAVIEAQGAAAAFKSGASYNLYVDIDGDAPVKADVRTGLDDDVMEIDVANHGNTTQLIDRYAYVRVPAAAKYPVMFGGKRMDSDANPLPIGGGTASYDPESRTLVLENVNYAVPADEAAAAPAALYAAAGLNLVLRGDNGLTFEVPDGTAGPAYGILVDDDSGDPAAVDDGSLRVYGTGTLDVRVSAAGTCAGGVRGIRAQEVSVDESAAVTVAVEGEGASSEESGGVFAVRSLSLFDQASLAASAPTSAVVAERDQADDDYAFQLVMAGTSELLAVGGTQAFSSAPDTIYADNYEPGALVGEVGLSASGSDKRVWSLAKEDWPGELASNRYVHLLAGHTATWKDEDGSTVLYGPVAVALAQVPEYGGSTPYKAPDAQYTYAFEAWSSEPALLDGDVVYTARYSKTVNEYTITWANRDGAKLAAYVEAYGATPAYRGPTPTYAATAQYAYEFTGWTPAVKPVTGDATYTATYSRQLRAYSVTFQSNGGTSVATQQVFYGSRAEKPANPARSGYTFAGWYADKALTDAYNFSLAVVAPVQLYAKWTRNAAGSSSSGGSGGAGSAGSGSSASSGSSPAKAGSTSWERLYGSIALDTMAAIVDKGGFATGGTVVLVTVNGYWDALAGAGAAGLAGAPVLMTDGSELSSQTRALLRALAPKTIVVCGGTAAVSASVERAACAAAGGASSVRLAGANAIGTAIDIYEGAPALAGDASWSATAFVCTSNGYWDALSAAPVAYAKHMPIFLTDAKGAITQAALDAMKAGGVKAVYLVGGTAAIPASTERALDSAGIAVNGRLWGATALETSQAVAQYGQSIGMSADKMGVATNGGYWDALAGAALCGKNGSVLVLVGDAGSSTISGFVKRNAPSISTGYIFGGPAAVSAGVESALKAAAA